MRLGTAVRTVAKWSAEPDLVPVPEIQSALDTVFARASDDAKARFTLLLASDDSASEVERRPAPTSPADPANWVPAEAVELRLTTDPHIGAALEWLDRHAGWSDGTTRRRVAETLAGLDQRTLRDRGNRRGKISRGDIAHALTRYYSPAGDDDTTYRVICAGHGIDTSLLTRPAWLDLALPYGSGRDSLTLVSATFSDSTRLDTVAADAAVVRLAETLAMELRLTNTRIYRMLRSVKEGAAPG